MIANRFRPHKMLKPLLAAMMLSAACASVPEPDAGQYHHARAPRFSPERPVVVIPGFGNSKLFDAERDTYVWGTPRTMIHTSYEDDLDLPVDPSTGTFGADGLVPRGGFVGSRGPINIAWRIAHGLETRGAYREARDATPGAGTAEIHKFAFDFRLSATENARRLDAFIDEIRLKHADPSLQVDVIAFSAGGVVALTYAKLGTADLDRPETWEAGARLAASKVETLILVAAPQEGTNESIRVLVRGEKLIRRAWPPEMMASFPSVAEMLPEERFPFVDEGGWTIGFDVWSADSWEAFEFAIYSDEARTAIARHGADWESYDRAFRRSLERAERLRATLRSRPVPDGIRFAALAGDCIPTAERVLMRADRTLVFYPSELREGEETLAALLFAPGDGSIAASSAAARTPEREFFCRGHQGIASDPWAHEAMLRALGSGILTANGEAAAPALTGMESAGTR